MSAVAPYTKGKVMKKKKNWSACDKYIYICFFACVCVCFDSASTDELKKKRGQVVCLHRVERMVNTDATFSAVKTKKKKNRYGEKKKKQ